MEYTAGPWIKEENSEFVYALNKLGSNRFYLGVQPGRDDYNLRTSTNELDANAQLIAAAPELLEVLKRILSNLNYADAVPELGFKMRQAEDIIAKAEGGQ
jgi:hypothetical protein